MIASLAQPLLFLLILGTGISSMLPSGGAVNYRTFMFPGVIVLAILFTSLGSAMSIVWDREFGFLREMLVAPVRRRAIVVGKCVGGATIATGQGLLIIALAGVVGIPYSPTMILELIGIMLLGSLSFSALGLFLASRMQETQSFMAVMNLVTMPMFFLSGALFSTAHLPGWLAFLTKIDPVTYVVDPMRRVIFAQVHTTGFAKRTLAAPLSWGHWVVPIGVELSIVAIIGGVALGLAVLQFERTE
jgi:ABC-2 type transport system permease protein